MKWFKQLKKWLFDDKSLRHPECQKTYEQLEKTKDTPGINPQQIDIILTDNLESAYSYAGTLVTSNSTTVENVEEYIKSTQKGVKPVEIKFFDPKDNIKLDEAKATQIKKVRKPRKKNGNK